MALTRWSHSRWYIYESGDKSLSICMDGHVCLEDLNKDFDQEIEKIANDCSDYDKLELKAYLKAWQDFGNGKFSKKEYNQKIKTLRKNSYRKSYLETGHLEDYLESIGNNLNSNEVFFQIVGEKSFRKKIEDLNSIPVKILKFEQNSFGFDVEYEWINSKGKTIRESRRFSESHLLFNEYPLIVDEIYKFLKESETFVNYFKEKRVVETKLFIQKKINQLEEVLKTLDKKQ